MGQYHEDEQEAAPRGRDDEEIRSHELAHVIRQERAPRLRRRLPAAIMYFATVA